MTWVNPSTRSSGYTVTATNWNELVNNFKHQMVVNYTEFIASVSITATTEGTANSVVSSGAISYEAVPHLIEFFSPASRPAFAAAGNTLTIVLYDSTTALGQLTAITNPTATVDNKPVFAARRLTPTAASHTYNVKAYVSGGTGSVGAGTGGTGTNFPGYIRITREAV